MRFVFFAAPLLLAPLSACSSERDPVPTPCDGETCPVGQQCCTACSGPRFCAEACPGIACIDSGGGTDGGEGAPCRGDDDCGGGTFCLAPGQPPGCGAPCEPTRECEPGGTAPDGGAGVDGGVVTCGGGEVCVEFVESCCSSPSSQCRQPCGVTGCPGDDVCGGDGLCTPASCEDSFTCPSFTTCVGAAPGADRNGCLRSSCATDGTCGEGGFCVRGACYDTPGTCTGPAA